MLTPELETAIRGALDDATGRGHEFSSLEHLLLALLGDDKTAEVIRHCGGSVDRLGDKLEDLPRPTRSARCPRTSASAPSRRWRLRASCNGP